MTEDNNSSLFMSLASVLTYLQICGSQAKIRLPVQVSRYEFPVEDPSSKSKSQIHTKVASKQLENWKFSYQTHREPAVPTLYKLKIE